MLSVLKRLKHVYTPALSIRTLTEARRADAVKILNQRSWNETASQVVPGANLPVSALEATLPRNQFHQSSVSSFVGQQLKVTLEKDDIQSLPPNTLLLFNIPSNISAAQLHKKYPGAKKISVKRCLLGLPAVYALEFSGAGQASKAAQQGFTFGQRKVVVVGPESRSQQLVADRTLVLTGLSENMTTEEIIVKLSRFGRVMQVQVMQEVRQPQTKTELRHRLKSTRSGPCRIRQNLASGESRTDEWPEDSIHKEQLDVRDTSKWISLNIFEKEKIYLSLAEHRDTVDCFGEIPQGSLSIQNRGMAIATFSCREEAQLAALAFSLDEPSLVVELFRNQWLFELDQKDNLRILKSIDLKAKLNNFKCKTEHFQRESAAKQLFQQYRTSPPLFFENADVSDLSEQSLKEVERNVVMRKLFAGSEVTPEPLLVHGDSISLDIQGIIKNNEHMVYQQAKQFLDKSRSQPKRQDVQQNEEQPQQVQEEIAPMSFSLQTQRAKKLKLNMEAPYWTSLGSNPQGSTNMMNQLAIMLENNPKEEETLAVLDKLEAEFELPPLPAVQTSTLPLFEDVGRMQGLKVKRPIVRTQSDLIDLRVGELKKMADLHATRVRRIIKKVNKMEGDVTARVLNALQTDSSHKNSIYQLCRKQLQGGAKVGAALSAHLSQQCRYSRLIHELQDKNSVNLMGEQRLRKLQSIYMQYREQLSAQELKPEDQFDGEAFYHLTPNAKNQQLSYYQLYLEQKLNQASNHKPQFSLKQPRYILKTPRQEGVPSFIEEFKSTLQPYQLQSITLEQYSKYEQQQNQFTQRVKQNEGEPRIKFDVKQNRTGKLVKQQINKQKTKYKSTQEIVDGEPAISQPAEIPDAAKLIAHQLEAFRASKIKQVKSTDQFSGSSRRNFTTLHIPYFAQYIHFAINFYLGFLGKSPLQWTRGFPFPVPMTSDGKPFLQSEDIPYLIQMLPPGDQREVLALNLAAVEERVDSFGEQSTEASIQNLKERQWEGMIKAIDTGFVEEVFQFEEGMCEVLNQEEDEPGVHYVQRQDQRGQPIIVKYRKLDLLFFPESLAKARRVRNLCQELGAKSLEELIANKKVSRIDALRMMRLESAKGVLQREENEWAARVEEARLRARPMGRLLGKDSSLARTVGREGKFLTSKYKQL